MNDPTIAPAYEAITESMVIAALEDATIRDLATALDPGAFLGDHGKDGFRCPDCGSFGAQILDEFRWTCRSGWCPPSPSTTGGQRTRLGLRARVADSYEACLRLVQNVGTRPIPLDRKRRAGGRVLA